MELSSTRKQLKLFSNGEPKMLHSRQLTGIFELARAKLKEAGKVKLKHLQTRTGVIQLIEAVMGPCTPGEELKFLNAYVTRDTIPVRSHISRGPYKLSIEMRIAAEKCADHPKPLSMNSKVPDHYNS